MFEKIEYIPSTEHALSGNVALKLRSVPKHCFVFTLNIFAVLSLIACNVNGMSSVTPATFLTATSASPSVSPLLQVTPDIAMPDPDILITPAQSGQVILLEVGQVIGVINPGKDVKWQVSYASEVLEILTPSAILNSPGPQGWLFRAIAPGQTDLLLTSTMQPCPSTTPCPPIPARFVFTIEVK